MTQVFVNPSTITSFNILLRLNQTFSLTLICTDQNNIPLDFTGSSFLMQIKGNNNLRATVLLSLSSENNMISSGVDPTEGTLTLTIPVTTVQGITWSLGYFDILMTSSLGVVTVIGQGTITTAQGVTSNEQ